MNLKPSQTQLPQSPRTTTSHPPSSASNLQKRTHLELPFRAQKKNLSPFTFSYPLSTYNNRVCETLTRHNLWKSRFCKGGTTSSETGDGRCKKRWRKESRVRKRRRERGVGGEGVHPRGGSSIGESPRRRSSGSASSVVARSSSAGGPVRPLCSDPVPPGFSLPSAAPPSSRRARGRPDHPLNRATAPSRDYALLIRMGTNQGAGVESRGGGGGRVKGGGRVVGWSRDGAYSRVTLQELGEKHRTATALINLPASLAEPTPIRSLYVIQHQVSG